MERKMMTAMGIYKTALSMTVAVVIAMLALSLVAWLRLPSDARIPTHWNIEGTADGFADKLTGLLQIPFITVGVVGLVALLTRLDPRRKNVLQSQPFLNAAIGALLLMMLTVHGMVVLAAMGVQLPVNRVILPMAGILFMVTGNYMGKVRSNFFMGIRTPWTLSSELSWNKTNRLGGRLFVASGFAALILGLFAAPAVALVFMLASVGVAVLVCVLYSYWVWRQDTKLSAPSSGHHQEVNL